MLFRSAGGGIGGLTLALMLQRAGIPCRVYEAAPEIKGLGVGINILPHAAREFCALGLEPALSRVAVLTQDACFFNRFGQLIYREPLGRNAGFEWPQFSIHRGDLHLTLLAACRERLDAERLHAGWRLKGYAQDGDGVTVYFQDTQTGVDLPPQRGAVLIGCDGINSVLRKQLFPDEGEPLYSGVNMWRGVTRWKPFLSGACMTRAGWHAHGKMVIYPIRNDVDADGHQLINWVAEVTTPR